MRVLTCLTGTIIALAASTSEAQFVNKIKVKAQYRETKKGNTVFRNIFVTGTCDFPDGTVLEVGIRPSKSATYLWWVKAPISRAEFTAELGPFKESFPPGKYSCEAWFELDKQPQRIKDELQKLEEFAKCIKEDPEFEERYKKENPERYEKIKRVIAQTGRCVSVKQYGATELQIGSAEDAERASEVERQFVKDRVELAQDLLKSLIETVARHSDPNRSGDVTRDSFAAWATDWQDQVQAIDNEITAKRRNQVYNEFADTFTHLGNTVMGLMDLEMAYESALYGETAAKKAQLDELLKKSDAALTKDDKRTREALKKDLAVAEETRKDALERVIESISETLYGLKGLDPAPARRAEFSAELRKLYGLETN